MRRSQPSPPTLPLSTKSHGEFARRNQNLFTTPNSLAIRSQTCWQKPACVVTPNSPQELSVIVLVLTTLKTKFAIRGAGHKPSPGFNSIGSDGVLIALQNLNCLSISADKKTVTVGSGNRWTNVYDYLRPYKRQAIGGREPMVGVPGFLLGGMAAAPSVISKYSETDGFCYRWGQSFRQ